MKRELKAAEELALKLTANEKLQLIEHLVQSMKINSAPLKPAQLYGIWKDRIPADFDVESALTEIRGAWQKRMDA